MVAIGRKYTKTKRDYDFYVPRTAWGQAFELMAAALKRHDAAAKGWAKLATVYLGIERCLYYQLQKSLEVVCRDILHHNPKETKCTVCLPYNSRALRCYHATRHLQHHTECVALGITPDPNPL